jgi:hypothetical protein
MSDVINTWTQRSKQKSNVQGVMHIYLQNDIFVPEQSLTTVMVITEMCVAAVCVIRSAC